MNFTIQKVKVIKDDIGNYFYRETYAEEEPKIELTRNISMAYPFFQEDELLANRVVNKLGNDKFKITDTFIIVAVGEVGMIEAAFALLSRVRAVYARFVKKQEAFVCLETDDQYKNKYHFLGIENLSVDNGEYVVTKTEIQEVNTNRPF